MGKVNWGRVVLGGLLAGLVLNVVDYLVYGVIFSADMNAAMQTLGKPAVGGSQIAWFVVADFLFGIFLIWLYAAIRPRFGAGVRTAVVAGLALWVLYGLLHAFAEAPMGLFPMRMYVIGVVTTLIEYPIAAAAGAYLYSEPA